MNSGAWSNPGMRSARFVSRILIYVPDRNLDHLPHQLAHRVAVRGKGPAEEAFVKQYGIGHAEIGDALQVGLSPGGVDLVEPVDYAWRAILGAPWRRRDIVEVPFQSSIISEVEKEKNPDLVDIGRFVYVFSELRAKEGEWGLSPYTPVKGQQLPSSVTSINAAVEFARLQLPRSDNVDLRVMTLEATE